MAPVESQSSGARTHDRRLLVFVVVSLVLANVVQWAVCRVLHLGNPGSMIPDLKAFVHVRQWTDSWLPMMKSLDYFRDHPTLPIYDAKLYDTLIYSLASELPLVAMRKMGMSDAAMLRTLAVCSWLAVWGVAIVSLAMGRWLLRRRGAELTWPAVVAATAGRGIDVAGGHCSCAGDAGMLSANQGIFAGECADVFVVRVCGDAAALDARA